MKIWQEVFELINSNQNFLIVSHKNPDGDSLGSEIALALALMKLEKKVYIYNSDPPPERYSKFPKASLIQTEKKNFKEDVIIFVDCAEIDRIGKIKENIDFSKPSINIDHHIGNTKFGTINLIKPDYSSTAEIIYKLIKNEIPMDKEIATYLYIGILTDTGAFRYPNTTSHSLRVASELVEYGVTASQVSEFIWFTDPEARIKLLGDVLHTMNLYDKISIMYVTKEMLEKHRAKEEDTEEFIDYGLSIKGIETAAIIKEREDGTLKVSLRSKNNIPVQELAAKYGGGGHRTASGFTVKKELEPFKKELRKELEELVEKYKH
ncbi:bifunctional oligoribonuclease/PAP phosphatase NrnA [candidate division WOR-3 bacterium]|nr:bifunctional oligoribonuclease/PAP phosphatase NrnA [candidate division WOR-3 bacterium]